VNMTYEKWKWVVWTDESSFLTTGFGHSSATTLVCVWNTRVFRTALMALTERRTLWQRITRFPSPRRQVTLHSRPPGSASNKPQSVWEHLESQ
jgi:hypothetical protein